MKTYNDVIGSSYLTKCRIETYNLHALLGLYLHYPFVPQLPIIVFHRFQMLYLDFQPILLRLSIDLSIDN